MELFNFSILSNSSRNNTSRFQCCEILLDMVFAFIIRNRWLLNSECWDATEENLGYRFHIIHHHFLKKSFMVIQNLIIPHFKNDNFINIPIFAPIYKIGEVLWFFLLIFSNPIFIRISNFQQEFFFNSIIRFLKVIRQWIAYWVSVWLLNSILISLRTT